MAEALCSIGGVVSVAFGVTEEDLKVPGSEFHSISNLTSGMRGGISNGEDLIVYIGFKPTSSIQEVAKKGRHDPCIAIRAAIVCESMVALVLVDMHLLSKLNRI